MEVAEHGRECKHFVKKDESEFQTVGQCLAWTVTESPHTPTAYNYHAEGGADHTRTKGGGEWHRGRRDGGAEREEEKRSWMSLGSARNLAWMSMLPAVNSIWTPGAGYSLRSAPGFKAFKIYNFQIHPLCNINRKVSGKRRFGEDPENTSANCSFLEGRNTRFGQNIWPEMGNQKDLEI